MNLDLGGPIRKLRNEMNRKDTYLVFVPLAAYLRVDHVVEASQRRRLALESLFLPFAHAELRREGEVLQEAQQPQKKQVSANYSSSLFKAESSSIRSGVLKQKTWSRDGNAKLCRLNLLVLMYESYSKRLPLELLWLSLNSSPISTFLQPTYI